MSGTGVVTEKKFPPFSGLQSGFTTRVITQVPLKAEFHPPLVPRGWIKLLVNILQFEVQAYNETEL